MPLQPATNSCRRSCTRCHWGRPDDFILAADSHCDCRLGTEFYDSSAGAFSEQAYLGKMATDITLAGTTDTDEDLQGFPAQSTTPLGSTSHPPWQQARAWPWEPP